MSEDIEKLIKIQGILNKEQFHLCISTDLENSYGWRLFQVFADVDKYLSNSNKPIMSSVMDTIDDLINYLEKHDGFKRRW